MHTWQRWTAMAGLVLASCGLCGGGEVWALPKAPNGVALNPINPNYYRGGVSPYDAPKLPSQYDEVTEPKEDTAVKIQPGSNSEDLWMLWRGAVMTHVVAMIKANDAYPEFFPRDGLYTTDGVRRIQTLGNEEAYDWLKKLYNAGVARKIQAGLVAEDMLKHPENYIVHVKIRHDFSQDVMARHKEVVLFEGKYIQPGCEPGFREFDFSTLKYGIGASAYAPNAYDNPYPVGQAAVDARIPGVGPSVLDYHARAAPKREVSVLDDYMRVSPKRASDVEEEPDAVTKMKQAVSGGRLRFGPFECFLAAVLVALVVVIGAYLRAKILHDK